MKRFFSTIFRFIVLLVVLGIAGSIFFPQTAVQFFGEQQQSAIKTSLGCDMPTLETEFDYNDKIDELNQKLDLLIEASNMDTDEEVENEEEDTDTDKKDSIIIDERKEADDTEATTKTGDNKSS